MDRSLALDRVLRIESHSHQPLNIRGIFSDAGEIQQLYLYDYGVPGGFHYFVEYQRQECVERALQLQLGSSEGLRVSPITSNSLFVEQFRSCQPYGSSSQRSVAGDNASTWPRSSTDHLNTHLSRQRRWEKRSMGTPTPHFDALGRSRPAMDDRAEQLTPSQHPDSNSAPAAELTSNQTHISQSIVGPPTEPSEHYSRAVSPPYTLETRLVVCVGGQQYELDLARNPNQDPQAIIDLLKLSRSERSNWMMAGAHFRRIGNPRAAINTMHAMLEVMRGHGYAVTKLYAVFTLLAACEYDLATDARNTGDSENFHHHEGLARKWLQQVYGKSSPTIQARFPNALLSSRVAPIVVSPPTHPPPREIGSRSHRFNPMSTAGRRRRIEGRPSREPLVDSRGSRRSGNGPVNYTCTNANFRRKL